MVTTTEQSGITIIWRDGQPEYVIPTDKYTEWLETR